MTDAIAAAQSITFLYAEDPAPSWRFYEEVLGLPMVQDQGSVRIYAVAGGRAFLGVCQARAPRATEESRAQGGVVFTFVTDDVDGAYERLRARGAVIPEPPAHSAQYRIRHFFFRDPAGYLLEVQRFERPDWPPPPS
ncbi:MAG TPA: VOC family protein [Acetobacteraceae bacterium]|nr:VOC family protein [Acetobacteraceae bacterium]